MAISDTGMKCNEIEGKEILNTLITDQRAWHTAD